MDLLLGYASDDDAAPPAPPPLPSGRKRPRSMQATPRATLAPPPRLTEQLGQPRKRRHGLGQWPSFVSTRLRMEDADRELLGSSARAVAQRVRDVLETTSTSGAAAPPAVELHGCTTDAARDPPRPDWLHLSLSRPFALRRHEIEPVAQALREAVRLVEPFSVSVDPARWRLLPSEDQRRTFLAFDVVHGCTELAALLAEVDAALGRFGKPAYFDDPAFHASFAHVDELLDALLARGLLQCQPPKPRDVAAAVTEAETDASLIDADVTAVELKAGHLRISVELRAADERERGRVSVTV